MTPPMLGETACTAATEQETERSAGDTPSEAPKVRVTVSTGTDTVAGPRPQPVNPHVGDRCRVVFSKQY
jgi:hypothetical protein